MFSFPGFLPNKATVQGDHFLGSLFSADVAGSLARVPPAPTIFLLIGLKLSRFFFFFFFRHRHGMVSQQRKIAFRTHPSMVR